MSIDLTFLSILILKVSTIQVDFIKHLMSLHDTVSDMLAEADRYAHVANMVIMVNYTDVCMA